VFPQTQRRGIKPLVAGKIDGLVFVLPDTRIGFEIFEFWMNGDSILPNGTPITNRRELREPLDYFNTSNPISFKYSKVSS
jgi:hypothetical protein